MSPATGRFLRLDALSGDPAWCGRQPAAESAAAPPDFSGFQYVTPFARRAIQAGQRPRYFDFPSPGLAARAPGTTIFPQIRSCGMKTLDGGEALPLMELRPRKRRSACWRPGCCRRRSSSARWRCLSAAASPRNRRRSPGGVGAAAGDRSGVAATGRASALRRRIHNRAYWSSWAAPQPPAAPIRVPVAHR